MIKSSLSKSKEKIAPISSFQNRHSNQKAVNLTHSSSNSLLKVAKAPEKLQTSKLKVTPLVKKRQTVQIFNKSKDKNFQRQDSFSKDQNKQNLKPSIMNAKQQFLKFDFPPKTIQSKGISVKGIRNNLVKGIKTSNIKAQSPNKSFGRTSKEKIVTRKHQKQIEKVEEVSVLRDSITIKIRTPRPSQKKDQQIQEPNSILKYIPPEVLVEYNKVSASDFHFISTTQAHTYFKDVFAIHLSLNALFNVRIIDKASVERQQLKHQLIQSITIQLYLSKFQLPHLLRLYTIFQDANFIYLVMEPLLISTQDQEGLLEEVPHKEKINENLISLRIKELATTISQIHKHDVILRDLNVDFLRVQLGILKITLIDSAARLGKRKRRQSFLGDVQKIPQQLALGKSYGQLYDTWNIGILLYILSTGVKPFSGKRAVNQIKQINYLLPINMSKELTELIFRLLIEQCQRLTAAEILDHTFLEFNMREKAMVVKDLWAFWHYQH